MISVAAFLAAYMLTLSGCTGRANIDLVSLNMRRVLPTEALVQSIKPKECYWWINEENQLCLAMRGRHTSFLGKAFSRETTWSIVLGDAPAGTGRDYAVNPDTLRFRQRSGLTHLRGNALAGAVSVWDYGQATLRGRFRVTLRQQAYSVLTGWEGDARYAAVCEFTAIENPSLGREILTQTEDDGMKRANKPK